MYSSLLVCREILHEAKKNNIYDISPMKLIKLAYISHGFHLAILDRPLFNDVVEAWQHGPVIRSIYNAVKHHGKNSILHEYFDSVEGKMNDQSKEIIKDVVSTYGNFTALKLSVITHQDDTPWDKTIGKWERHVGMFVTNKVIDNIEIKKHYEEIGAT